MSEGQHVARLAVKGDTRNAAKELRNLARRESELERALAKANQELIRHGTAHTTASNSAAQATARMRQAATAQQQMLVETARRQREAAESRVRVTRQTLAVHLAAIEREKVARLQQVAVEQRAARSMADVYRLQNQADRVRHDARMARLRAENAAAEAAKQAERDRLAALGRLAGGAAVAAVTVDRLADRTLALTNVQANLPFSISKARQATKGLISDFDLMRQAIAANRLGVARSGEEFGELARIATTLGVSLGQDATRSLEDLTNGLGRASTEVLDNLGIVMRAEDAHKIYAQQIGKSVRELTDMEKRQAVVTVGLERGADAAAKATVKIDGWAGSWQRAKIALGNAADEALRVDDNVAELSRELVMGLGASGKQAEKITSDLWSSFKEGLGDQLLAGLTMGYSDLHKAQEMYEESTREVRDTIERGVPQWNLFVEFLRRSGTLGERAKDIVGELADAAGRLQDNVKGEQKRQFFEDQALGIQFLLDFAAPVEAELAKFRKEQKKKAAEAARQAAEAALQISVEEVRRERQVLEQKVRDREATTAEVVELIHTQGEAERQLAEFHFKHAANRADQLRAANDFNAATHTENMAILQVERQEREALIALHERAAKAHTAYVSTVAEQEIGALKRRNALERAQLDLQDQRALRGLSPDQAAQVGRSQALQRVRDEVDANARLREAELLRIEQQRANTTDRLELMRLEGEAAQLHHEAQLDRVRVMSAEESKRLVEEQQATQQRLQMRRKLARESTQFAGSMANAAIGIRRAENAAAEAAREAGESEAAARKKARGEGLIALGQDLQGRAISHTAAATAAFIMGNPVSGGQNLAAAGVFMLAGRTLMGIGDGMVSSAGGSGSGGSVGGTSFGGGGGPSAANGRTGLPSSEIPPSPQPGAAPQPGNPAGGAANDSIPGGGGGGARVLTLNINALSVDKDAARQLYGQIVELAAVEGF